MANEISSTIENLKFEIEKLDDELAEIANLENLEKQKAIAINVADEWETLDPIKKKEFLNVFVKSVYISHEGIKKVDFIL